LTSGSEPYVIGLTGNIATGKSTVAAMLGDLGACLIDADELAHWAMRAGSQVNRRIVQRFGSQALDPNGEIDRAWLGALVFSDPGALRDLEVIVHPVVIEETLRRISACEQPVVVVEAIKLLEAEMDRHCDAVWVVTSSRRQQIERLVRTRHLTAAQAELRVDAQPPAQHKVARADVVIDNDGELTETWGQVAGAWNAIPGAPKASEERAWRKHRRRRGRMKRQRRSRMKRQERETPVSKLRAFCGDHPRLTSWIALSVGMVALLLWGAWNKGLTAGQLAGIALATICLAGACAWIIGWE